MFIDAQTQLSSAQAVTSTAVSSNTYDLGAVPSGGSANGAAIDPSIGEPLCVVITVGTAADLASTDETYEFDVIQSASSNLGTPDTLVQVAFTHAQSAALTAGAIVVVPIPAGRISKRYLGLNYVTGGTTPSITCSAFITTLSAVQKQAYYTSAIVIN